MSEWDVDSNNMIPVADSQPTSSQNKEIHAVEASAALGRSLRHITDIKLDGLSKRQERYAAEKSEILQAVANTDDTRQKVKTLLDAFERYKIPTPSNVSAANTQYFVKQSCHDSTISSSLLREWQTALEQALEIPSRKYQHASLFGRLVMEWLGNAEEVTPSTGSEGSNPFELVGPGKGSPSEPASRKEMHDQRREWESIVFAESPNPDAAALEAYLRSTFDSTSQAKKLSKAPLELLRETMGAFNLGDLDAKSLETCIVGVLKTDLLSESKRKTLAGFLNNSIILQEVVDVLNMQIDDLDSWSWGEDAIKVDVRRASNGQYRVYMDEEILQALLLYFIGTKWGVHMKTAFLAFFRSGAWKQSSRQSMDRQARLRRRDFLGRHTRHGNVRDERRERYQREYFLSQLPASFENTSDNYHERSDHDDGESRSPMATKQSLLHLLSTETLMNTRLYGSFTVLQSDFRWFGPSIPHATVIGVLRFFGVTNRWLKFFLKFLEAPIKFAMDGPDASTRIRRSGVPIQHRLSDALGEAVLFCLDFAINKATESNVYRLHDDIWFWGDKDSTVKAWQTLQSFTAVTGLRLNEGKTGAVELSDNPTTAKRLGPAGLLPSGPIVWGFLKMGPSGRWIINDALVETHINELKTQLEACKSIFAWVRAWNTYVARFLSNHFGEPAECLGRPHLDMVIEAFESIQRRVFDAGGLGGRDVIEHLRAKLAGQFGVEDMPDGFFLFPIELGGLGLVNPLIPLFRVQEKSLVNPMNRIEEAIEGEEADYDRAKKVLEEGTLPSRPRGTSLDTGEPMSLDEYTRYREETSVHLYIAYTTLMNVPEPSTLEKTPEVAKADQPLRLGSKYTTNPGSYDHWILELYGPDIIRRYGGLEMSEKKLLPIGLASLLQTEKVRWQG